MAEQETAQRHVERIITDLSRPDAYPEPVGSIEVVQTHASVAFLTDALVFKVKKPVDFGFLDFSTLPQRRFYCEEELRLNRRLTHGVYLDVLPIVDVAGRLQLGAADEDEAAVEYAVKMTRLPNDQTLAALVESGRIDAGSLRDDLLPALAERLSRFYIDAATGPGVDEWGGPETALRNIEENVEQTEPYVGTIIASSQLRLIDEVSHAFFAREGGLFGRRLTAGAVREGHGDLHLAHIYVSDLEAPRAKDIQILDCIEFNPRLRCGDVSVDIAFLAMDLDYHRRPDLAREITQLLAERLHDSDLERLVHFFSIYRAHVRNKVACLLSSQMEPEQPGYRATATEAERYIDLATSYIVEPERPTLFVVGGLSGSGKSVVARRVARSLGIEQITTDVVRKELAGRPAESHKPAEWGAGIYTPEFTERTYQAMFDRAGEMLAAGRSVVLDGTFLEERLLQAARDLAANAGVEALLIECHCPPEVVRERLERRAAEQAAGASNTDPSEAGWEVYQRQRERFGDSLPQIETLPRLTVETDRPSAQTLDEILSSLHLRRRL